MNRAARFQTTCRQARIRAAIEVVPTVELLDKICAVNPATRRFCARPHDDDHDQQTTLAPRGGAQLGPFRARAPDVKESRR
jgi:hypothetical protein